jgi:hypothetical protein
MAAIESARYPRAVAGLEWSELEGGLVAYDQRGDTVSFLNPAGAMVLELCNGRHTPAEIAAVLQAVWSLPAAPLEAVAGVLEQADAGGLLDWLDEPLAEDAAEVAALPGTAPGPLD